MPKASHDELVDFLSGDLLRDPDDSPEDAEPGPGNWKPIQPGTMSQGNGETAFFIQKGSKMNQSSDFDEGFDEGAPF